ncbi:MAG TPA: DUF357 domain-containing protein [archaeon]|nr:DUF357 domain-containing protein [archaeon]
MTTLEEAAKKEIAKMQQVMESLKLADGQGENKQTVELKQLAEAYFGDAVHFLHTGKFLQAFETAVIAWAYVDSGLHLGIFTIDKKFEKYFTV